MEKIEKIITDIIEDNTMKLVTPTGKSNTEYYQTKIDVCNQILEKVHRENAESEQSNCTIPPVIKPVCNRCGKKLLCLNCSTLEERIKESAK